MPEEITPEKKSAISVQREVALFVVIQDQIILDADYLLVERNWARTVLCMAKMLLNLISSKRALNHRGASSGITFIHLPIWQGRELIDLIHDTHHLCTHLRIDGIKANIKWYFRGQTNDKICHCEKSRSTLFILSKQNNDSVTQNVRFEFRQN